MALCELSVNSSRAWRLKKENRKGHKGIRKEHKEIAQKRSITILSIKINLFIIYLLNSVIIKD